MSHRKLWVLGIVSILLLSTVSQAHAELDDDNTEVRAGKVKIIRDADGNTQIETEQVKIKSESPKIRRSSRYRHSIRHQRNMRRSIANSESSVAVESCFDRKDTIQGTNSSSSSINHQVTKIRGNNRTVIQSSTDR